MSAHRTPASHRSPGATAMSRRRLGGLAASGAVLGTGALLTAPSPGAEARERDQLANPGFAEGLSRWRLSGQSSSAQVRAAGGRPHVLHLEPAAGQEVAVSQRVVVGRGGERTLRALVRAGGDGRAASLELRSRNRTDRVHVPVTGAEGAWLELAVSAPAARGILDVTLRVSGAEGAWAQIDELRLTPDLASRTVRGADLSGIPKNEEHGAVYTAPGGAEPVDPVELMAHSGATLGRLRVWVDPADGYCTPERTVEMARRIRDAGMDVLVDFHYSDTWTDPGAQHVPAAWAKHDPGQLADAVAEHTRSTLTLLRDAGVDVAMVQVGNEINPGMLWPHGQTWDVDPQDDVEGAQWENLARFLRAGAGAVADVFPAAEVMLHLTNLQDGIEGLTWWLDEAVSRGVPLDVIGLSYYPYWHGTLADLQEAISTLGARYERDVIVVETACPFTLEDDPRAPFPNIVDAETVLPEGYPPTPGGQAAFFRAVQDVTAAAEGGRGRGVVYWEPAWTAVEGAGWDPEDPSSGNAWENQAMFDFSGAALPEVLAELGATHER